ncbi:MAG: hypothetical protein QM496_08495 [Verrucomicrobiota bacterium]
MAGSQPLTAEELIEPEIGDPYPLEICILSGETLEEDYELIEHQGQEIRVCCSDCKSKFTAESYIRVDELNALLITEQMPVYPLEKCIVTGKALEQNPIDFIFRNRLFRISSEAAKDKIKQQPTKYFDILDAAVIAKQSKNYPLKTCLVSGKTLTDGAIDHVIANQLVRLADFEQLAAFEENPGKYLRILHEAK